MNPAQQLEDGSWQVQVLEPWRHEVRTIPLKRDVSMSAAAMAFLRGLKKRYSRKPGDIFFDDYSRILRTRPAFRHPSGQVQEVSCWDELLRHIRKDERRYSYNQMMERR